MAAVLTAVPFALIHMPLQFIGEFSAASLAAALVLLLIVSMVFRLLLGVVLRGARDSVLAVALLHTMFNRSNNSDGIVAALVDGPGRGLAALSATAVLAAIVAVVIRRRLTRSYRLEPLRALPPDQTADQIRTNANRQMNLDGPSHRCSQGRW
jgi:hypothetical protein